MALVSSSRYGALGVGTASLMRKGEADKGGYETGGRPAKGPNLKGVGAFGSGPSVVDIAMLDR